MLAAPELLKVALSKTILSPWEYLKSAIASTPRTELAKDHSVFFDIVLFIQIFSFRVVLTV
ncbi:MAG: hypothetical protein KME55_05685 [Nostoc indistinguendum CM1-VF10]|nr:hypothetical protein [Nostoc indistinguendum CM1-VF10]